MFVVLSSYEQLTAESILTNTDYWSLDEADTEHWFKLICMQLKMEFLAAFVSQQRLSSPLKTKESR